MSWTLAGYQGLVWRAWHSITESKFDLSLPHSTSLVVRFVLVLTPPCVVRLKRCNRSIAVHISFCSAPPPAQLKVVSRVRANPYSSGWNGKAEKIAPLNLSQARYLAVAWTRMTCPDSTRTTMLNCSWWNSDGERWKSFERTAYGMDLADGFGGRNCSQFFKNYAVKYLSPAAALPNGCCCWAGAKIGWFVFWHDVHDYRSRSVPSSQ